MSLSEGELDPDPIRQFHRWFEEATLSEISEPNAMVLATASPDGRPSARIVLLRGYDERGFVFFTNYESRKGRELEANPHAALVFHWHDLERQVRVEGPVERISAEESDAYFQSRPAGSRLGPGPRARARSLPIARSWKPAFVPSSSSTPTARFPAPSTGADTASFPRSSSSGKADPAGCTTGCGTPEAKAIGSSSGCRRDFVCARQLLSGIQPDRDF